MCISCYYRVFGIQFFYSTIRLANEACVDLAMIELQNKCELICKMWNEAIPARTMRNLYQYSYPTSNEVVIVLSTCGPQD